MAAVLLAVKTF